ncbi:hypothetical protein [Bacillus sp. X1(2014)]|nr:hypothetical protein [Bacillus sp. X1(2014)]
MAKNKNNQFKKNKTTPPNAPVEFSGENGLEKVARQAQKSKNK